MPAVQHARHKGRLLPIRGLIFEQENAAGVVPAELGHDPAWERVQVAAFTALARGYIFTDPASRTA